MFIKFIKSIKLSFFFPIISLFEFYCELGERENFFSKFLNF